MKHHPSSSRFDESETDQLIANFGIKMSPEKWSDMQNFLSGQKEEFLTKERSREKTRQSGRDI
jgi:hypothetical protein